MLCKPCNTKWGSTFENRTKPDIWPICEGETRVVSLLSARRLAAWLCLKAMVAEYLADDGSFTWRFFDQSEREHLRQRAHPPECVKAVWIGRYVGERGDGGWFMDQRFAVRLTADPETIGELYVVTLAIGELVFQLVALSRVVSTDPSDDRKSVHAVLPFIIDGPWEDALIRIWPVPTEPAEWPPRLSCIDHGRC